jgi:hypothetical protein
MAFIGLILIAFGAWATYNTAHLFDYESKQYDRTKIGVEGVVMTGVMLAGSVLIVVLGIVVLVKSFTA